MVNVAHIVKKAYNLIRVMKRKVLQITRSICTTETQIRGNYQIVTGNQSNIYIDIYIYIYMCMYLYITI